MEGLSPNHETRVFALLDDGAMEAIPAPRYAALLRGEPGMPQYARRRARIADLYVELHDGRPATVSNETYSILYFDDVGKARPLPDADLIRENKSLHVASLIDPYADAPRTRHGHPVPAATSWTPTTDERSTRGCSHVASRRPRPRRC